MSAELLATGCLFAFSVISTIYAARKYEAEKKETISLLKTEVALALDQTIPLIEEKFEDAIGQVADTFENILSTPTVKKAFSIIGKQGGEAKAHGGLVDKMAGDMLSNGQLSGYLAAAEMAGLDVKGYVEEHGAVQTLKAAQQLAGMFGMDLGSIAGQISQQGGTPSRGNPYLGRR